MIGPTEGEVPISGEAFVVCNDTLAYADER